MITDSLRRILRHHVNVDTDAGELAMRLHAPEPDPRLATFRGDLTAAIRAGDLTPEAADEIMMRDFDDQAELDRWLRSAWAQWFPDEPYPV